MSDKKRPLHVLTCGSVDDGKSTLIGRLLFDSKKIYRDQLERLKRDSERFGTQGDQLDLALLVDGLAAEREQGITIDVAYRFFSTNNRHFIIADSPGHEQYTRNMVTGASHSRCALILIDASRGVSIQTKRHAFIANLLGINDLVVVVNKMDAVGFREEVFDSIKTQMRGFLAELNTSINWACIPISALRGDNVVEPSKEMIWYQGLPLLTHLENVNVDQNVGQPWVYPVQLVSRPNAEFRGYAGTVSGEGLKVGSDVMILPSRLKSKVKNIVTFHGNIPQADDGMAVTVCLEDERDVSKGDVLAHPEANLELSDQLQITVIWMDEDPLHSGRSYFVKTQGGWNSAVITKIKHVISVESFAHEAANQIEMNQIGVITIALDRPVVFKPYQEHRTLGSLILVDKLSNQTVGAGLITYGLRRASNVKWQTLDVDKVVRSELKHQKPCVLWFTGLSGSGKSTVANLVEKAMLARGRHTYLLDGDNVRHGLCQDLGFTTADRVENIRRVGEVSKLMVDAGLIVLTSFISPFKAERRMVRSMLQDNEFVEIFVDAPLAVCERRDVKGLYAKARSGEIKNFTGFDSPYEKPLQPEITLKTAAEDPEESAKRVISYLEKLGFLTAG